MSKETPYETKNYVVEWEPALIGPPGTKEGAGCIRVIASYPCYNEIQDWMARDLIDALKEARPGTKAYIETRRRVEL